MSDNYTRTSTSYLKNIKSLSTRIFHPHCGYTAEKAGNISNITISGSVDTNSIEGNTI